MNDEFLHRLRRRPPARLASSLKARLDLQELLPRPRFSWLRPLVFVALVGGMAAAATLLTLERMPANVARLFKSEPVLPAPSSGMELPVALSTDARRPASATLDRSSDDVPAVEPAPRNEVRRSAGVSALSATEPPSDVSRGGLNHRAREADGGPQLTIAGSMNTYSVAKAMAEVSQKISGQSANVMRDVADGIQAFCFGRDSTNMAIVSKRISPAQMQICRDNGMRRVVELKLGYQAVVLAGSKIGMFPKLTRRELYLALAKRVPDPANPLVLIDNPYLTWNQINPALAAARIEIYGPLPDAALRETLFELVMEAGCDTYPWIRALKPSDERRYEETCHALRDDGAFIEAAITDYFVTQVLWSSPDSLAVVPYAFYADRKDKFNGSLIEGVDASFASVASGNYVGARTLYAYVNRDAVLRVRGFSSFLRELTTEPTLGAFGVLVRNGVIPLADMERQAVRAELEQTLSSRF